MLEPVGFFCAYCGSRVETSADPSAGLDQRYVEDCHVCCRPNVVTVRFYESGEVVVDADPES